MSFWNKQNASIGATLTFIISPFSGKTIQEQERNVEFAKALARRCSEQETIPIVPHIYFPGFLNDSGDERICGIESGHRLMTFCNKVMVATIDHRITEGMKEDINFAIKMRGIKPTVVNYTQAEAAELISSYHKERDARWSKESI